MTELEAIVRQIVREEIAAYLGERVTDRRREPEASPQSATVAFDDALFEEKYQAAVKMDEDVHEKYAGAAQRHGDTMTVAYAADVLKTSRYGVRKLAKTDANFPPIVMGKISTARLMHWLDGGTAYWRLDSPND